MSNENSDQELIDNIQSSKKIEDSLKELIYRHSCIYLDMVNSYASPNNPFIDYNELIQDKEYRIYSAAIKLETAQLVVDQGYTQEDAAKVMGVGKSTVSKWVTQLKQERNGQTPTASPMTPEQIEIRELKKQIQRIELEKDILKKATALLMSDSLNNSR